MSHSTPFRPTCQRPWTNAHQTIHARLVEAGWNPWLARALVLRGIDGPESAVGPAKAEPYHLLKGLPTARARLVAAIEKGERIVVVADYDCDGATACALMVEGLRSYGANIGFAVPNRLRHGYGLSPGVVDMIAERDRPSVLVTVDNGIASVEGVAAAARRGWDVVVTDHHLPGDSLPLAQAIVNPNQAGCIFPSKHLAGCGVAFMVVAAVHAALKRSGRLPAGAIPPSGLLDLVALGTVADVVRLDANNRWLVTAGLGRIRRGQTRPGILALFDVARRSPERAVAGDFGFSIGPRLNAAGRLDDMTTGIRCLLSATRDEALALAEALNSWNDTRKTLEADMLATADRFVTGQDGRWTRVAYDASFHEGVVGLVASRIKEATLCATMAFAPAQEEGYLKGSGRSVPGLHLRDALDRVHKLGHGLFERFGGHAMAAGVTLRRDRLDIFTHLFESAVRETMGAQRPDPTLWVDGVLTPDGWNLGTALAVRDQVWGQGFEEPLWEADASVRDVRRMGAERQHLKVLLDGGREGVEAIEFFVDDKGGDPRPGEVWRWWFNLDVSWFRDTIAVSWRVRQKERLR